MTNLMSMFIIFVIIIIFAVILSMLIIWSFEGSVKSVCCSNGYMRFKSFLSFYNINPNRWELHDDYIVFHNHTSYRFADDIYCLKFIDFYRYKLWKRKEEKYVAQVKSNQKYQEMIDIIKQDIADYEKRNQKEVAEKLNEIWKER